MRRSRKQKCLECAKVPKVDELVKSKKPGFSVIPAKAGIQLFQHVLDPGACPGPDPGFVGVTTQETFYETIILIFPTGNGHVKTSEENRGYPEGKFSYEFL